MVALYKEYMGRGPTHARTTILDDLVVCVLTDNMTKAEHKLAESNQALTVSEIRRAFQSTLRDEAVRTVEAATGREVLSFLSDHDTQKDIAVEIFVLVPEHHGSND